MRKNIRSSAEWYEFHLGHSVRGRILISLAHVFMSHPESLEVGMNAILSELRKTLATERMKTCFGRRRGLRKLVSSQGGKTIMRKERRNYGNVLPSKTIGSKKTRQRRCAAGSNADQ